MSIAIGLCIWRERKRDVKDSAPVTEEAWQAQSLQGGPAGWEALQFEFKGCLLAEFSPPPGKSVLYLVRS